MTAFAYLLWSPSKLFKLTQWNHEIKGRYARDDPAFVMILCGLICLDFIAFDVALNTKLSLAGVLVSLLWGLVMFMLMGVVAATLTSQIADRYFNTAARHAHAVVQRTEWFYAWDVHCGALVPVFVLLGVVQYLLLPLLGAKGFVPALLSNALYLLALGLYFYVTFLGYLHLPFLNKDAVSLLLAPVVLLGFFFLFATLVEINSTRLFLGMLF